MANDTPKIGFVSLGCPKALVDSELILTQLRAEGYDIAPSYDNADLVVINTCGFIDDAVTESLDSIGEALNENGKVIVTGCLGAKGDIVKQTYPEVLAVTGPHALHEVMDAVHAHLPKPHDPFLELVPEQGIKLTPRHYAYLKISEGCNHRCSFCIIPALRGDLVSRPIGEVMQEAENLVQAGVKELLVISQDTSAYGVDVKYRTGFWGGRPLRTHMTELTQALGELGVWVRLHYVYPYPHVDEVIPLMENVLKRLQRWRELCPDISIRSTFIVGFPGETEEDFAQLLDFLDEAQLDRVGCFMYSPVEGAAANALHNHVSEELKQERLERFMEKQAAISADKLKRKIGQHLTVLVDHVDEDGIATARSAADAPEIDGVVIIDNASALTVGEFTEVEIINSDEHDLFGQLS
ncbi:MAG: radical SAM protein [Gammaproteobacteria bacterium]